MSAVITKSGMPSIAIERLLFPVFLCVGDGLTDWLARERNFGMINLKMCSEPFCEQFKQLQNQ